LNFPFVALLVSSLVLLNACNKKITLEPEADLAKSVTRSDREGSSQSKQGSQPQANPTLAPTPSPTPQPSPVAIAPIISDEPVAILPPVVVPAPPSVISVSNSHIAAPSNCWRQGTSGDDVRDFLLEGKAPVTQQGCYLSLPINEVEDGGGIPDGILRREIATQFARTVPTFPFVNQAENDYDKQWEQFSEGSRVCIVRTSEPNRKLYCGRYGSGGVSKWGTVMFQPYFWYQGLAGGYEHVSYPSSRVTDGRLFRNQVLMRPEGRNGNLINNYKAQLQYSSKGLRQINCNAEAGNMNALPFKMGQVVSWNDTNRADTVSGLFDDVHPYDRIHIWKGRPCLPASYKLLVGGMLVDGIWNLTPGVIPPHLRTSRKFSVFDYHDEYNYKFAGYDGAKDVLFLAEMRSGIETVLVEKYFWGHPYGETDVHSVWVEVFGSRVRISAKTWPAGHGSQTMDVLPLYVEHTFANGENLSDGLLGYGASVDDPFTLHYFDVYASTQSIPSNGVAKVLYEQNFDSHHKSNTALSMSGWSTTQPVNVRTGIIPDRMYMSEPGQLGAMDELNDGNAQYVTNYKMRTQYEQSQMRDTLVTAYVESKLGVYLFARMTATGHVGAGIEQLSNGNRRLILFREAANGVRTLLAQRALAKYVNYGDSVNVTSYEGHLWLSAKGNTLKVYYNGEPMLTATDSNPVVGKVGIELDQYTLIDSLAVYQWR